MIHKCILFDLQNLFRKLALQYDYDDIHQPKQYVYKGDRLQYTKNQISSPRSNNNNSSPKFLNTYKKTQPNKQLKLNSQYFESHANFYIPISQQKDNSFNQSKQTNKKGYQSQNPQPSRLKKSISISDLQTLRKNQNEMANKIQTKLNTLQNQNDKIKSYLKNKQKSAQQQPLTARYKSETKISTVEKDLIQLKDKLEKERIKEKQRLEHEIKKIKEQNKKIKEEQRIRKKSFKQLLHKQKQRQKQRINSQNQVQQQNQLPNRYIDNLLLTKALSHPSLRLVTQTHSLQSDKFIRQKLDQIQQKYLPKTNIVNKRIQCDIITSKNDIVQRIKTKPQFAYNDQSETDSEFSDY